MSVTTNLTDCIQPQVCRFVILCLQNPGVLRSEHAHNVAEFVVVLNMSPSSMVTDVHCSFPYVLRYAQVARVTFNL